MDGYCRLTHFSITWEDFFYGKIRWDNQGSDCGGPGRTVEGFVDRCCLRLRIFTGTILFCHSVSHRVARLTRLYLAVVLCPRKGSYGLLHLQGNKEILYTVVNALYMFKIILLMQFESNDIRQHLLLNGFLQH